MLNQFIESIVSSAHAEELAATDGAAEAATAVDAAAETVPAEAVPADAAPAAEAATDMVDPMAAAEPATDVMASGTLTPEFTEYMADIGSSMVTMMGFSFVMGSLFTILILILLDFMRRNSQNKN